MRLFRFVFTASDFQTGQTVHRINSWKKILNKNKSVFRNLENEEDLIGTWIDHQDVGRQSIKSHYFNTNQMVFPSFMWRHENVRTVWFHVIETIRLVGVPNCRCTTWIDRKRRTHELIHVTKNRSDLIKLQLEGTSNF